LRINHQFTDVSKPLVKIATIGGKILKSLNLQPLAAKLKNQKRSTPSLLFNTH